MEITLCLYLMMQSCLAAQTQTTSRPMKELDNIHLSTNVSYSLVDTPALKNQSYLTNQFSEGQHPALEIPTIWIVMATILFSTIVITIGVFIGIRIYFKRQSKEKHQEEYFKGFFMTTAVYMAIPKNCVPPEYCVKTFPVSSTIVYPIVTNEENKQKQKNKTSMDRF